jgi:hypothetical protein
MERRVEPVVLTPRLQAVYEAFKEEAVNPTGKDPYFRAMSEAAAEEIIHGEFGGQLEQILEFREHTRPPLEGHHAMNFIRRALQKQYLKMYPDQYPILFDEVEMNRRAIREMLKDESVFWDFDGDLQHREVQSNVAERYKAFKLIAHMYRDRLGSDPSILDVGCSLNLGLKKMALSGHHTFDSIEVLAQSRGEVAKDYDLERAANKLIASRLAIGASMGVDVFSPDFNNIEWVRSCSFYPGELLKPARIMTFDDLSHKEVAGIGFHRGDFTNDQEMAGLPTNFAKTQWQNKRSRDEVTQESLFEMAKFMGERHREKGLFDMAVFCTSMYLMDQEQRLKSIERARGLVRRSGIIVIQDFAELDPREPTGLQFHENFSYDTYPYRTYVISPRGPEIRPQHIFSWENGRAHKLRLESGRLSVKGEVKTPAQLIGSF